MVGVLDVTLAARQAVDTIYQVCISQTKAQIESEAFQRHLAIAF